MRIVQIFDTHISRNNPARVADLEVCIDRINALDPKPDVVVHTGDVAHDGLAEEYATARAVLDTLTAPYFVIPGNRDNRHELIDAFADGRYIQKDMAYVQYAVEAFDTRLIFADTASVDSNKGRVCEQRMAEIAALLRADASRPIALFLHHPPFPVPVAPDPFQYESWSNAEQLAAEFARHPNVRGIFCGHVHRTFETALGSVDASTLTCVARDLRKGVTNDAERNRPVFKVHCIG